MKKECLARTLERGGVLHTLLLARARLRIPLLTVLTYHRVVDATSTFVFDEGVVDADPREFGRALDLLQRYFNVVTLDDVVEDRRGRRTLPPNPALITFDDGYRDNHDVALPMLRERGMRAVFFIATAYPDAGELYWWDKLALLVRRATKERAHLDVPAAAARLELYPKSDPGGTGRALFHVVKHSRGIDLRAFLPRLAEALGASIAPEEERELARASIMGWREIVALRTAGMEVESHSHRHLVLGTLSPSDLAADLRASRLALLRHTGMLPRAIAYPVGYSITAHEREIVSRAGFEIGFTNATGIGLLWGLDTLQIPRISTERTQPQASLLAGLAVPFFAEM